MTENALHTNVEKKILEKQRAKRRVALLCCACLLLAGTTGLVLMRPASTQSQQTFCGFEEHTHSDKCYEVVGERQLICTVEEGAITHEHTDVCYEEQQTLICTLMETEGHTHTDSCYEQQDVLSCGLEESAGHVHTDACYGHEQLLSCGREESAGHVHDAACYDAEGNLICTVPEGEGAHAHDASCYTEETSLICGMAEGEGAHTHSDACYTQESSLICGQEECEPHSHTDECYAVENVLICEESTEPHVHTDACYAENKVLACDKPEHTHTLICFSNKNPNAETPETWDRLFAGLTLTGNWNKDAVVVAASQLGYSESGDNYEVGESGTSIHGFTRYGAWYGYPYGEWCAMFCSFVYNYAGVNKNIMPFNCACRTWVEDLSFRGLYHANGTYLPQPGDLIFFDMNGDDIADHVGLVYRTDETAGVVTTIEGNRTTAVDTFEYYFNDFTILGYGHLPQNPDYIECTCGAAEGEPHAEACPLYAAPLGCTCGAAEGEPHAEACPLYAAPLGCTCGAAEGAPHTEDCPLWQPECTCGAAEGEEHTEDCPVAIWQAKKAAEAAALAAEAEPTCTCGAEEGEPHAENCPLYEVPLECTCGAAEGEPHAEDCPLYQPECTCGAEEGEPHAEDCPLWQPECTCGAAEGEPHAEDCPLYKTEKQPGDLAGDYGPFTLTAESDDGIIVTMTGEASSLPYPAKDIFLTVRHLTGEEAAPAEAAMDAAIAEEGLEAQEKLIMDITLWHKVYLSQPEPEVAPVTPVAEETLEPMPEVENTIETAEAIEIAEAPVEELPAPAPDALEAVPEALEALPPEAEAAPAAAVSEPEYYLEEIEPIGPVSVSFSGPYFARLAAAVGETVTAEEPEPEAAEEQLTVAVEPETGLVYFSSLPVEEAAEEALPAPEGSAEPAPVLKVFHFEDAGISTVESAVENGAVYIEASGFSEYGFLLASAPASGTSISSADDLVSKLADGGNFRLTANITVSSTCTINSNKQVTLNLNGHTITYSGSSTLFSLGAGSTLTIDDTVSALNNKTETLSESSVQAGVNSTGKAASYSNNTLTYYVTKTSVTSAGHTSEDRYEVKVPISGKGQITRSNSGTIVSLSGSNSKLIIKDGVLNGNDKSKEMINASNSASVEIKGGILFNSKGGAVYSKNSTVTVNGGLIAKNERGSGAGICCEGGKFVLNDGTISCNKASSVGGGVWVKSGTAEINGGYLTNNRTNSQNSVYQGGGGIACVSDDYSSKSTLTVNGGYITGNYAGSDGGGILTVRSDLILNNGFISGNCCNSKEGAGISLCATGNHTFVKGYITNNYQGVTEDWGGGGVFIANGSNVFCNSIVIFDNSAGGYGGGLAGCSTGNIFLSSDPDGIKIGEGGAIFDNTASGRNLSGDSSSKNEDRIFASKDQVFLSNGYQDYFCALNSAIWGSMAGGGIEYWSGSADGAAISSDSREDVLVAQSLMGLTAHPSTTDKNKALDSTNAVFVSGNYAYTHGGGILCNGTFIVGNPDKIDYTARLVLTAKKSLKEGSSNKSMTAGQFHFTLKDANGNVVAKGTNDASGNITFDRRIVFDAPDTFEFFLTEDEITDTAGIVGDSKEYKIIVTTEKTPQYTVNINGLNFKATDIKFKNIDVYSRATPDDTNWTKVRSGVPDRNNETDYARVHGLEFKVTGDSTTFTNYKGSTVSIAVEKTWETKKGTGKPNSLTVKLIQTKIKSGKEPVSTIQEYTLKSSNSWKKTWSNLPLKDDNGYTYTYDVEEVLQEGSKYVLVSKEQVVTDSGKTITFKLKNSDDPKFSLNLKKVDIDNPDAVLKNAVFQVLDNKGNLVHFAREDEDLDNYRYKYSSSGSITSFTTPQNGILDFTDLPAGTYTLHEVSAPRGHDPVHDITFTLPCEDVTSEVDYQEYTLTSENTDYSIVIKDPLVTYALPKTGGPGVTLFYISGILLASGALIYGCIAYSKKREGRHAEN